MLLMCTAVRTEGPAVNLHELPGLAGLGAQRPQLPPRQLAPPKALRGHDAPPVPPEVRPRGVAPPGRLDRQRRAVLPARAGCHISGRWLTRTALQPRMSVSVDKGGGGDWCCSDSRLA